MWPDWFLWLVLPFLSNTQNRCCRYGVAQDSFVMQDHHPMYLLTQLRNHLDLPHKEIWTWAIQRYLPTNLECDR
jgi:hypothetical protein